MSTAGEVTWWDRIDAARILGRFTSEDVRLAGEWVTCACGEQDLRLRHAYFEFPWDDRLAELGEKFARAVSRNVIEGSAVLLRAIEQRAAVLLANLDEGGD